MSLSTSIQLSSSIQSHADQRSIQKPLLSSNVLRKSLFAIAWRLSFSSTIAEASKTSMSTITIPKATAFKDLTSKASHAALPFATWSERDQLSQNHAARMQVPRFSKQPAMPIPNCKSRLSKSEIAWMLSTVIPTIGIRGSVTATRLCYFVVPPELILTKVWGPFSIWSSWHFLDKSIHLHKHLAEILENFTNDLKADLDELNQRMAQNGREADSYFMKMSSHVEDFTSKMQSSLESVSVKAEVSQIFLKHGQ